MLYSIIVLQFCILSDCLAWSQHSQGYFLIKDNLLIELVMLFFVCIFCIYIQSSMYLQFELVYLQSTSVVCIYFFLQDNETNKSGNGFSAHGEVSIKQLTAL